MKLKNLIYICVAIVLVIICFTVISNNINNNSNFTDNNSKINNTNNISNTNSNTSTNTTNISNDDSTTKINSEKNHNGYKNIKKDNKPAIPKKSKLTYNEAYKIAKEGSKGADYDESKTYIKYEGYDYSYGELHWNFIVYSKKNNKQINIFSINDNNGNWQ